ncbi:NUDIX hydrolase [Halpernia frigidisoli]|uniref:ADP-ribose pyrophosphatase YjhB, NUDIX family n=1 Tax=Halpernia frigidisoli TaxID=1125876 RepID=A0A1I3CSE9_9FLAO|nr:NUDIX domain-containing protein [Halpernia frigidisoli]SFH77258.1 ADP-ribose pyrophosphatase YjhB, NUDIX family [Halpernia frigidisoli]
MYKVFVNEKKLSLTQLPELDVKHIKFDGAHSLEMAVDFLENTASDAINIYGENLGEIWNSFKSLFKQIEASGGVVYNQKKEILFIHRLGKWDLPKGKLEKGETIEENAVREVEEETGLKHLILGHFINETYHIYTERDGKKILKKTNWFKMLYEGNETPIPQIEEGIKEVSWKNNDMIKNDVLPKTFQNIKLILEEAAKSENL